MLEIVRFTHALYTVVHKNVTVNFLQQFFAHFMNDFHNFCTSLTRNEFCTSQYQNVSLHVRV